MNVEVRHLRYFLAVAEELNFTRAAERIPIAQQALSAQIAQLEALLGARLFERTTRRVTLTAAGEALREHASAVLGALDEAVAATQRAARGQTGALTIGLLGTSTLDLIPEILRAFSAERPEVAVSVRNVAFDDPSGGVRSGEADVAVVWLPFDTRGLVVEPLLEDPRIALLPAGHPLTAREALTVGDLLDEPFGWIEGLDPVAADFWTLAAHRNGRPPRIGAHISGLEDYVAAIRAGQAVACSPRAIATALHYAELEVRPVMDAEPAQVAICRRAGDERPLVAEFVRLAQEGIRRCSRSPT